MNYALNNQFDIKITIEELKEKIREYYQNLYDSISKIEITYSPEYVPGGFWSEAWQCNLGGRTEIFVDVTITQEVKALNQPRTTQKHIKLKGDDLTHIFSDLLKNEHLKATYIHADYSDKNLIVICCQKLVNKSSSQDFNLNRFLSHLSYVKNDVKEKVANTVKNLFN